MSRRLTRRELAAFLGAGALSARRGDAGAASISARKGLVGLSDLSEEDAASPKACRIAVEKAVKAAMPAATSVRSAGVDDTTAKGISEAAKQAS